MEMGTKETKIKLMAPAESMETVKNVIEAGADEIYLGLMTPAFVNLNFSGRGQNCNVKTEQELKAIVDYAHEHNVRVFYTINTPFMNDSMEDAFIEHVKKGVDAGVDALIVGEIGALEVVAGMDTGKEIHASVLLNNFNVGQIKLLKELGAMKAVLPFKVTIDEIKEMGEHIETEVFGQFGCSNTNGTCHLIHNAGESINFGLPCRANYLVSHDNRIHPILDAGTDCSLCSIPALTDAGVGALKVVGRCMNPLMIKNIIEVYRGAIDMAENGASGNDIKAYAIEKIPFWQMLCEQKRCKYLKTPVTDSYV